MGNTPQKSTVRLQSALVGTKSRAGAQPGILKTQFADETTLSIPSINLLNGSKTMLS